MRTWLIGIGIAVVGLIVSWAVLLVLARRLPPGILRDLAAFVPDCVITVRRLRRDPRVPRRAKIAVVIAGIWVASPIDLIPEFIPIIGPLDDIVVVALALRYAGRHLAMSCSGRGPASRACSNGSSARPGRAALRQHGRVDPRGAGRRGWLE